MEPQKEKEMSAIEQIKAELKGKQIIVISENDGIANIKWDCRSLDDVKALLASAQSFIADKQVEELRGIGSGPDYNTTEGRFRNAHKFQQGQPEVDFEKELKDFLNKPDFWDALNSGEKGTEYLARHFYELGLNAREEKPCEDLEKEAKEFAEREYECDSLDRDALEKGFYWGAKWQKEQMMEGAVDATVVETTQIIPGCGSYTGEFKNKEIHLKISEGFEKGEKVKVIIVKEDRT